MEITREKALEAKKILKEYERQKKAQARIKQYALPCSALVYDYLKRKNDGYGYDALVYGDAQVYGDAWVFGDAWVSGEELVAKAFNDSELSGKCYEAAVKFVEELERIKKENLQ